MTRLRWALDHGYYPPWKPAETKHLNTEMVTITRPAAPHGQLEHSDQTPEKQPEGAAHSLAPSAFADGGARRGLNLEGGPSMQEVRLSVVFLLIL